MMMVIIILIIIKLTTDKYQCPCWNSNLQSQQTSGRRRTASVLRPLGTVVALLVRLFDFVAW
jgi:hypothetical protein